MGHVATWLRRRWLRLLMGLMMLGGVLLLAADRYVALSTRDAVFAEPSAVPTLPVALVLGTAPHLVGGGDNPFYVARMEAAVALYRAGKVQHLLVSGDNSTEYYNEPVGMQADLMARGIPEEAITIDYAGFRTLDSVVRADAVFAQDSFVVVSQRFHVERAVFLARAHDLYALGFVASGVEGEAGLKVRLREVAARVKAMLDVWILDTDPRFYGDPVEIDLEAAPPDSLASPDSVSADR